VKIKYLSQERGFLSLLGMVLTLSIICFLAYLLLNTYFKMPLAGQKAVNAGIYPDIGLSTGSGVSGYRSIVNNTRGTLDSINKQHEKQIDDLMH